MPFDGSGVYNRNFPPGGWQGDAANSIKIKADRHDTHDKDLADALSFMICKDGQSTISADIPWNSHKITGLANPANPQDAATRNYVDGVRSFSTAITISGSSPESVIKFTGTTGPWGDSYVTANMAAGVSGTTWVWNDKADFTGTNVMALTNVALPSLTITSKDAGASAGPMVTVMRDSASPAAGDNIGQFSFQGKSSTAVATTYGQIFCQISDPTQATTDSSMFLQIRKAGTATNMVSVSGTGMTVAGTVTGGGSFVSSSTTAIVATTGAGSVYLRPNGAGSSSGQFYVNSAGDVVTSGNITVENNTTFNSTSQTNVYLKGNHFCKNGVSIAGGTYSGDTFNCLYSGGMHMFVNNSDMGVITFTSDYRIKKDVADLPSTWDHVKTLRPISYTHAEFYSTHSDATKAGTDLPPTLITADDDIERWGFIAHETQAALVETAASGTKDMVDGVQALNLAPILAATVKALQEAMLRIEALEARA